MVSESPEPGAETSRAEREDGVEPLLEELAEDMLDLLGAVRAIEERQRDLATRLDRIEQGLGRETAAASQAIDSLRRDLLGERRAQAVRQAFEVVAPALESLRGQLDGLRLGEDARIRGQLRAAVSALSNLLHGLGFEAFEALPGEPFDPERMECLGFAEGPPGVVLEAVRHGFRSGEIVMRPAGVLLAAPAAIDAETNQGEKGGKR